MAEIIKLTTWPGQRRPNATIAHGDDRQRKPGARVEISVEMIVRWFDGFDVRAAALACLRAGTFDDAVVFWTGHVARLRAELTRRGADHGTINKIVSAYTCTVRVEITAVRAGAARGKQKVKISLTAPTATGGGEGP